MDDVISPVSRPKGVPVRASSLGGAGRSSQRATPPANGNPASPKADGRSGTTVPMLAILRLLASADRPLGVNAIARELSMAPSSCHKFLKQLHAEEFVDFDELTKRYSLGSGAIALARRALDPDEAFSIVRPRLQEATQRFSISSGFWRVTPRSRIVLAGFVENGSPTRIRMSIGQRLPLLMGGVGRAIAAKVDLNESEMRAEFAQLRWQVPVSFEDYTAEVADAREKGYAVDSNHFAPGVITIGAAIQDRNGMVRYGLSGIMFSGQHDEGTIEQIGAELVDVADWASKRLISA
jgi:DNA-binding IclR family transcriptional regulator